MTRSQAREIAFILLFEKTFTEDTMAQIIEQAAEDPATEPDPFARRLALGAASHLGEIDDLIASCSRNWKIRRISRVALSALRVSIYEILFDHDIPAGVSINEAVELTKKYASPDDASFVNGVLGSVARGSEAFGDAADKEGQSAAGKEEKSAAETPGQAAPMQ